MERVLSTVVAWRAGTAAGSETTKLRLHVARLFTPAELDVDDLAEAIRLLLGPEAAPQIQAPDEANSKLLSLRKRGTHGVEAEAP